MEGNWGIIRRDANYVYKTYEVGDDDTGGHAVREYLVSRLGISGCTPAEVSWGVEGGTLKVTFKMPRRVCTLRDILQGKFTYGGTLWAQMSKEERVAFGEKVVSDLLIPLAGLSSAGMIHSDLHDNNIVFNQETGRFDLIDFGFTCLFSPTQKRRADLMGWCPPPERLGGPSPVPLSADTWALGCIFVMCLQVSMSRLPLIPMSSLTFFSGNNAPLPRRRSGSFLGQGDSDASELGGSGDSAPSLSSSGVAAVVRRFFRICRDPLGRL